MKVTDIAPIAIVFVVAGVAVGMGSEILDDVKNDVTVNTTAAAAVENATQGIGKLAKWLPTIGLVIAAAIIIGVLTQAFGVRR